MRVLLVLLVILGFSAPAAAFSDGDRAAVQGIIEQQLQAFLRDDGATAYSFAAPTIKKFGFRIEVRRYREGKARRIRLDAMRLHRIITRRRQRRHPTSRRSPRGPACRLSYFRRGAWWVTLTRTDERR